MMRHLLWKDAMTVRALLLAVLIKELSAQQQDAIATLEESLTKREP